MQTIMATEKSEWVDRDDHPLLNELILQVIFDHVRKIDLKECRLVCKKWNVLTIPFTRSAFTVTIYGNQANRILRRRVGSPFFWRSGTISEFVELFRKNELGNPVGKFKLGAISKTETDYQEFLVLCGNTITGISFIQEDVWKIEDVSTLLRSTPKLEAFQIPRLLTSKDGSVVKLFPDNPANLSPKLIFLKYLSILSPNPAKCFKCCPTFTEEILMAAPNVQVEIYCGLGVLRLISKLGIESSIKTLHVVSMGVENKQIILLQRMIAKQLNGLKLRNLVDIQPVRKRFDPFQLITLFKDTLEFFDVSTVHSDLLLFPRIPHLKEIKLSITEGFNSRGINLKYIFPQLRKLEFRQCGIVQTYDEFLYESDPCPTIKSFKLYRLSLTINSFYHILTIFPELTHCKWTLERVMEQRS